MSPSTPSFSASAAELDERCTPWIRRPMVEITTNAAKTCTHPRSALRNAWRIHEQRK